MNMKMKIIIAIPMFKNIYNYSIISDISSVAKIFLN